MVTPPRPRLLDRVRALRARHYSWRTEEAYVAWIKRYVFFHAKRHPAERRQGAQRQSNDHSPAHNRNVLSATQPVPGAPWAIRSEDLALQQ
jgi:hypothetical protein